MAAGGTYESIATNTLSSSQATITFSSISASYTDLVLITVAKLASGTSGMKLQFNADTANNYSNTFLFGLVGSQGSVANSSTNGINFYYGAYLDSSNFAMTITNIMNYANTTTVKSVISRDGSAKVTGTDLTIGTWRKTPEAINSIDVITTNASVFASGSTFTLYGIKAA
jgi:hypothetical protein